MSHEIEIEGRSYISSKRASELSGYAQDYIGQLARKNLIDAKRVGGLWYVSMEALLGYKQQAENFKPELPVREAATDPSTLVFLDGKEYLSAARAAEITGYHTDYVGQLARSGTVLSQQVGNRWYVEKKSIVEHKKDKDALLAAVQVESVGLQRPVSLAGERQENLANISYSGSDSFFTYSKDEGDLMPTTRPDTELHTQDDERKLTEEAIAPADTGSNSESIYTVPIRRVQYAETGIVRLPKLAHAPMARIIRPEPVKISSRLTLPLITGALATVIIVLSVGYTSLLKQNSAYAIDIVHNPSGATAFAASAETAFKRIGDWLEPYLSHELIYQRPSGN
jgi:hypothetical protein